MEGSGPFSFLVFHPSRGAEKSTPYGGIIKNPACRCQKKHWVPVNAIGVKIRKDDEKTLRSRAKSLYDLDEKEAINVAHKNSKIIELYNEFLGETLGKKCRKFLHTKYSKRDVLL